MRTATEVGSHSPQHSTAVGKAILASQSDAKIRRFLHNAGSPIARATPHTHSTHRALLDDFAAVRRTGYAVDDQKHQLGARSYAVAIAQAPVPMAVTDSPISRVDAAFGARAVPALHPTRAQLGRDRSM